jgi:hypothetical protein
MRYVIAICILTGLIIWDGAKNNGEMLDLAVRQLRWVLNYFGAGI